MIVCSPKAVSPREYKVEETDGRDDDDWVSVVLWNLENNFGNRQLFEGSPWLCSEGTVLFGVHVVNMRMAFIDHMPQAAVTPYPEYVADLCHTMFPPTQPLNVIMGDYFSRLFLHQFTGCRYTAKTGSHLGQLSLKMVEEEPSP